MNFYEINTHVGQTKSYAVCYAVVIVQCGISYYLKQYVPYIVPYTGILYKCPQSLATVAEYKIFKQMGSSLIDSLIPKTVLITFITL